MAILCAFAPLRQENNSLRLSRSCFCQCLKSLSGAKELTGCTTKRHEDIFCDFSYFLWRSLRKVWLRLLAASLNPLPQARTKHCLAYGYGLNEKRGNCFLTSSKSRPSPTGASYTFVVLNCFYNHTQAGSGRQFPQAKSSRVVRTPRARRNRRLPV